jgi:hypothetical protein
MGFRLKGFAGSLKRKQTTAKAKANTGISPLRRAMKLRASGGDDVVLGGDDVV